MGKKKLLALLMATVLAMQPTISVTAETGQVTDSVGDYEGEETKEKSKKRKSAVQRFGCLLVLIKKCLEAVHST